MKNNNVIRIFIDTEFTDFKDCDLISIGCIADTGQEFYGENTDFQREYANEWVQENIYPLLNFTLYGHKRHELSARLWEWLDSLECDQILIMWDYQKDYDLLLELLTEPHPKFILGGENVYVTLPRGCDIIGVSDNNYAELCKTVRELFHLYFSNYFKEKPSETQHISICDARANKIAFYKAIKEIQKYVKI